METQTKVFFKIENNIEIEPEAFTLIGASTKRDDNTKIGFFGSGLKYAIAVLLENEIDFKIYSGLKEIKITTKAKTFRDNEFHAICINGKETSLTTTMGADWKAWFAIREIYCNAIDEGKYSADVASGIKPQKGKTQFYIEMNDKLEELMQDWSRYFSDKRQDIIQSIEKSKIFKNKLKTRTIIYRKGIQCEERWESSLFDYDLDWAEINESRVLKDSWETKKRLAKVLARSANKEVVKSLLEDINTCYFEKNLYWDEATFFNEEWLKQIGNKTLIPYEIAGYFAEEYTEMSSITLPSKLTESLKRYFGDRVKVAGTKKSAYSSDMFLEPNERQEKLIEKSVNFIKQFYPQFNHPIKVCQFSNISQLGEALNDEILLSPSLFEKGTKKIIAVILEESFHLKSGCGDNTRGFQDYLINQLITLIEQKNNIYL